MLLEFRVKNFKSIKDELVLSAVNIKDRNNDNNIINTNNKLYPRILKSLLITGPNASGKSNILEAMYFFKHIINISSNLKSNEKITPYKPFLLNNVTSEKPSEFEISILIKDIIYTYGFAVDNKKIHKEYLYYYPKNKRAIVFERVLKKTKQKFIFGISEKEQKQLETKTNENKLYLCVASDWNFEIAKEVIEYIRNKLNFINKYNKSNINVLKKIKTNKQYKDKLLNILNCMDFGIKDFKITEKKIDYKKFIQFIESKTSKILSEKDKEDIKKNAQAYDFKLMHNYFLNKKKQKVFINIQDESRGTGKVLLIMGEILDTINNNNILIIDELEENLHPYITKYLVKYINSNKNKRSQFIFTTHCYNLLDTSESKLRHDQILFTERKDDQSTELFSLADFTERKDINLNIKKRYFEGRYGAKPFVDYGDIE